MERIATTPIKSRADLVTLWAVGGVTVLLVQGIVRLSGPALEPFVNPEVHLEPIHAGIYFGWVVFNLYVEGYRVFHRRWCPRVVARSFHLAGHPRPAHVALAPLFAMSFFHARPRTMIAAWAVFFAILAAIVLIRSMPQPWRGIVDGGVVAALLWAIVALWTNYARWRNGGAPFPPDLPEREGAR